jgi:outer membrane protein TolC
MPIIGALKGESDYQNKVADEVERVTAEKRAGNATQEDVDAARSQLWTTHGQRTATDAEMQQIAAILTRMNGNKPMTYADYQRLSAQNGGKE